MKFQRSNKVVERHSFPHLLNKVIPVPQYNLRQFPEEQRTSYYMKAGEVGRYHKKKVQSKTTGA
jgi:hypothetical protein